MAESDAAYNERSTAGLRNGRFSNPWPTWHFPAPVDLAKFLLSRHTRLPSKAELDKHLGVQRPAFPDPVPDGEVRATWLGHASVLFQLDGARVLCDPIFSERCSPSQYFGPKRYRPAPCQVADLPPLDAVVISHTHYDHLDYGSVLALHARFPELQWFVPRGCKSWMQACGPQHVQELTWWEEAPLGDRKDFRVVFTPTQHWSGRGAFDRNRCLWGSWALLGPQHRAWFAGDTGYCAAFKEIGESFGPFDMAAIPIGAYCPRKVMMAQHVDPEEAVKIHLDIKSKASLGIHWGTFALSCESVFEPPGKLQEAVRAAEISAGTFITVLPGQSFVSRRDEGLGTE